MGRPTILIGEDHALVIEAFTNMLEPEYRVVGSATDGRKLLTVAQQLKPDVILIDIGLPLLNGATAGEKLKQLLPRAKLIVVTMYEDVEIAAYAMRHWASGYLLKTSAGAELANAVREVLKGNSYLTPSLAKRLSEEFIRNPNVDRQRTLTPRQRDVLQLLAEGRTMTEAADLLELTPRTIAFHKYQIMEEFGLRNGSQLVLLAIKEQLSGKAGSSDHTPPHLVMRENQEIDKCRKPRVSRIARKTSQKTISLGAKLIKVQEDERQRIARELHDDIGQRLALLSMGLDRLQRTSDLSIQQSLLSLLDEANSIADRIRNMSHDLHSPSLSMLSLATLLRSLCRDFTERSAIEIQVEAHNLPSHIPQEITLCLYRSTQEALQNIFKHSRAAMARVVVTGEREGITLKVIDNGIGFEPNEKTTGDGLGLASIRERVASVAGTLSIMSAPERGTQFEVYIPLPSEATTHRPSKAA